MDISELYEEARIRIPDAATPLVELAARRALAEFFKKSTAWRTRIQTIAITAEQARYEVNAESPICATTDLRVLETQAPIHPRTVAQMDAMNPAWRLVTGQTLSYFVQESPSTLLLYAIPETTENHLDVEVALYPGVETAEIPDWIGEMYRDQLSDGICGVLYGMREQKWANANEAESLHSELISAARSARIRVEKSNTRAPQVARFTSFDDL